MEEVLFHYKEHRGYNLCIGAPYSDDVIASLAGVKRYPLSDDVEERSRHTIAAVGLWEEVKSKKPGTFEWPETLDNVEVTWLQV